MRKIAVLFLALTVTVGVFGFTKDLLAADKAKIGYIDISGIFDEYDKTKTQQDILSTESEGKKNERQKMVDGIRNMKNELELLSDKQRDKKQQQINDEIRKLQDFDREARVVLGRKRDNMMRDILKEIDAVVKDYANKNSYTLIIKVNALAFGQEQDDITKEILNILNSQYRRKK